MKIPDRTFLLDIGLVGMSCFALACSLSPIQPEWVVTWEQTDGSIAKHRVEANGRDEAAIRRDLFHDLTKTNPANVGMVRWQKETSQFYAEALRPAAGGEEVSTFQTASFNPSGESSPVSSPASEPSRDVWQSFWAERVSHSQNWLDNQASVQAKRIAAIDASMRVSRWVPLFPNRATVTGAIVLALIGVLVGSIWHGVSPPRTIGNLQTAPIGSSGVSISTGSHHLIRPHSTQPSSGVFPDTETAAMSFRKSWVRVRQPISVRVRQTSAWSIVILAMVAVAFRLTAT